MKHRILLIALASYLLTHPLPTSAAPPLINYQGRIAVGSTNFDGTGHFKFALVDGGVNQNTTATAIVPAAGGSIPIIAVLHGGSGYVTAPAVTITDPTGTGATAVATVTLGVVTSIQVTNGGSGYSFQPTVTIAPPPPNILTTSFWNNDGTSVGPADEPATAVSLPVTKGLYSVLLGDSTIPNMAVIDPAFGVFNRADLRLRVWFSDGVNPSQLLSPDQRLAPAAYLADGSVTAATIEDGAITSAKILDGAITGTDVAEGSLGFSHLGVPSGPIAGQVLGFDGNSFSWVAPGGGGGNGNYWAPTGANIYYSSGNVGIGTATTTHRLTLAGGPAWTSNGWTGALALPNASAIGWAANAAGQSFGMGHTNSGFTIFRSLSNPGSNTSAALYDMFISDAGNVGIGTGITPPLTKLAVSGGTTQPGLSVSAEWVPNQHANIELTGERPTIKWSAPTGSFPVFSTRSWIAHVGATRGLEFWTRSQTITTDTGWLSRATLATDGSLSLVGNLTANDASVRVLTIRGGADVAEPFQMKEQELAKGSVVVIDDEHPGRLKQSIGAYDKRVAGIISGANGVSPGIALHQEGVLEGGQNVALSGRVYVRADATNAAIKPGDLLTTSDTPGHAMKVTKHTHAQGAVIGKAMSSLDEGTGMVLVLVTLQ